MPALPGECDLALEPPSPTATPAEAEELDAELLRWLDRCADKTFRPAASRRARSGPLRTPASSRSSLSRLGEADAEDEEDDM
jgi:hypothetical protein